MRWGLIDYCPKLGNAQAMLSVYESLVDDNGGITNTRWCPPSDVSWFIIPLTIDISPTKTIVIGVMFTNLAIERGHHLVRD